ncbi:MAG: hypothetical protein IPL46_03030 [Saprospiraceae bacterium]|nr:hypothetical protein [Saprospiraceae bacterium]
MLSSAELKALERDFVLFLASQGISADLWQQYISSEANQINEAIVAFSDYVLEQVYSKCRLIEFVTANGWLFYHFNDETTTIEMRGITIATESSFDFRELDRNTAINMIQEAPEGTFRLIKAEKAINSDKTMEVHGLLTRGGFISENLETYHLLLNFI